MVNTASTYGTATTTTASLKSYQLSFLNTCCLQQVISSAVPPLWFGAAFCKSFVLLHFSSSVYQNIGIKHKAVLQDDNIRYRTTCCELLIKQQVYGHDD
ncbi:hypothetical protein PS6_010028 [Mucor atramentarius]